MTSLRGVLDLRRRTSTNKRVIVRAVRANQRLARPGLWVTFKIGYAETLGLRRSASFAGRWTRPRGGRLRRNAVLLVVALSPPAVFIVRRSTPGGAADAALQTKQGGLILFDRDGGVVTHVLSEPARSDYQVRRDLLARYFPVSQGGVSTDLRRIVEKLEVGSPLMATPLAARVAVARDCLARQVNLATDLAAQDSVAVLEHALAAYDRHGRVGEPVDRELRAARSEMSGRSRGWPIVPAHGDLTGLNVICGDGHWALIDFEDASDLPYFYDSVCLLATDPGLSSLAVAAGFDGEMRALRDAVGLQTTSDSLRLEWMATALIAASRHAELHDGPYADTLRRLWPPAMGRQPGGTSAPEGPELGFLQLSARSCSAVGEVTR